MATGRDEAAWNHTSAIIAWIVEVNRDPKQAAQLEPDDFHPYRRRRSRPGKKTKLRDIPGLKEAIERH